MNNLLKKVQEFCTHLLDNSNCCKLPFHNLTHTQEVVKHAIEISKRESISNIDLENILIAAWFHDTGFSVAYRNHEKHSKIIAAKFLNQNQLDVSRIDIILKCIEVTKLGSSPQNILEKILCDADLYHLTKTDYFYRNILLRKEWECVLGKVYSDYEWYKLNHRFLTEHTFNLAEERKSLKTRLGINIKRLEALLLLSE